MQQEEWNEFANHKYALPEHYVFAYLLGEDVERRVMIKKFAKRNNLKIVAIPHVCRCYIEADEDFADVKIRDAGPREFVSLVKNADFILTDSFHGTAFAIIFEKQFFNFSRFKAADSSCLNIRLKNINEDFGLERRHIDINTLDRVDLECTDAICYANLNPIALRKKEEGLNFLNSALS